jgi:hypothetical protein
MAGERTKQDNSVGIDNSSGVAKAYDFERVNALLTSKAASLEECEERLIELVNLWEGETNKDTELVKYPESFDVRGLYDEFEISSRLSLIEAPMSVRKEQMREVIKKLFPRLSKDLREQIKKDIDEWSSEEIQIPKLDSSSQPTEDTD